MFLLGKEGHTILRGKTRYEIKGTIDDIASNLLFKLLSDEVTRLKTRVLGQKKGTQPAFMHLIPA